MRAHTRKSTGCRREHGGTHLSEYFHYRFRFHACNLDSACCEDLHFLIIKNKSLIKLDLSGNKIQDLGLKMLCKGLTHSDCSLQELRVQECELTSVCCEDLDFAINTNLSLKKLDLSSNKLKDSGVKSLCTGLKSPKCSLKELMLSRCYLTQDCCEDLCSIIALNHSLIMLDLSENNLQDSGLKLLCAGLKDASCTLQELRLQKCLLTSTCCEDLQEVLIVNRSVNKLRLRGNMLQDPGVKYLCAGLRHPNCTLQELGLESCDVTSACCEDLLSVITRNQSLTKLQLGGNKIEDLGIKILCEGLRQPNCKLQELRVPHCGLTQSACEDLSSVIITSNTLINLDLSGNKIQDTGVQFLCSGLVCHTCRLQELSLRDCHLKSSCCENLLMVLTSNHSLILLDLSWNNFQDSGKKKLYDGLKQSLCSLQELRLESSQLPDNFLNDKEFYREEAFFPVSEEENACEISLITSSDNQPENCPNYGSLSDSTDPSAKHSGIPKSTQSTLASAKQPDLIITSHPSCDNPTTSRTSFHPVTCKLNEDERVASYMPFPHSELQHLPTANTVTPFQVASQHAYNLGSSSHRPHNWAASFPSFHLLDMSVANVMPRYTPNVCVPAPFSHSVAQNQSSIQNEMSREGNVADLSTIQGGILNPAAEPIFNLADFSKGNLYSNSPFHMHSYTPQPFYNYACYQQQPPLFLQGLQHPFISSYQQGSHVNPESVPAFMPQFFPQPNLVNMTYPQMWSSSNQQTQLTQPEIQQCQSQMESLEQLMDQGPKIYQYQEEPGPDVK
ncbi:NACHT, LRR and PYD domains-containing 3-like [Pelobates cultripes]|uniref:NACHT, LRR and PYD domains-containing 3-like n=1 Tax=Pelobates cultripes TaxID=61616 RepID=A0AAD1T8X5_PELCU|nr:NACHT, LRR and PYD domains-containing 3-like [Pelobates cultripes]